MSLIIPIVVVALILGVSAKRMNFGKWALMSVVILVTIAYFNLKH